MKKGLIQLILISSIFFVSNTGIYDVQPSQDQTIVSAVVIPDGDKDDPGTLE